MKEEWRNYMSGVKRVYAEKKQAFAVQAKALQHEIKSYLGIRGVTNVRVLIRYDIEICQTRRLNGRVMVCLRSLR